jgi:hypothetical protein
MRQHGKAAWSKCWHMMTVVQSVAGAMRMQCSFERRTVRRARRSRLGTNGINDCATMRQSESRRHLHLCCKQGPVRARTQCGLCIRTAWLGGEQERQRKHERLEADVGGERGAVPRRFTCQRADARSRRVRGSDAPAVATAALLAVKTEMTFPVS